jgi:nicotinate phosphoribosyltransferase
MAHSFILAHGDERAAFLDFARSQPDNVVLLIDTFDTEAAARKLVELVPWFHDQGIPIKAVRLDSGDLAAQARQVRAILDEGGLQQTRIFCSGDLDEYALERLLGMGAPIDGFGVGTRLVTIDDGPYLECAYKLQAYGGVPRRKRSAGKATWPGAKQVFRRHDETGQFVGDLIGLAEESHGGEPLLAPVMRDGRRIGPQEPLAVMRERLQQGLLKLPEPLKALECSAPYEVAFSERLQQLAREVGLGG